MITRAPRPTSNFYLLDKAISEDKRLSWAARGVLIFLLGKPDNWTVSPAALVNETAKSSRRMGRDGVYAVLKELKDVGYLHTIGNRNDGGTFAGADYLVTETPYTAFPDTVDSPYTAQPYTAKPDTANPTLVSTEKKQGLKKTEQGLSADAPVVVKPESVDRPEEVSQAVWADFLVIRKDKRAKLTGTALAGIKSEAVKAGWTLEAALTECCTRGWQSFRAEWVANKPAAMTANRTAMSFAQQDELAKRKRWEEMTGRPWPADDKPDYHVIDINPTQRIA